MSTLPLPDLAADRPYWVLLSMVPGIGPARFQRLLDVCGTAQAAWQASDTAMAEAGLDRKSAAQLRDLRRTLQPDAVQVRLERLSVRAITSLDAEYPSALLQINDPPPVLYVRGSLPPEAETCVAFVGTRRSSPYGRTVAEQLARAAAVAGVTVVSGLARGIDTAAHRAALDAGGRTIAVLGHGLDQVYPPENSALAHRMADSPGSGLLTEFGLGTRPDAINFPRRNRIIAGLCRATIIVEAGVKSGALITADFALEQGRDVLAVPGSILSPLSAGPNGLIRQGATPITGDDDLLEALGIEPNGAATRDAAAIPVDLSPDEQRVYAALGREPRHADELARELGGPAGEVVGTLTLLELKGLARQVGGLAYVRG